MNMNNEKRVCIFVDGENLRHAIGELFPSFDKRSYLPKSDWTKFFDWVAREAMGSEDVERIRTYWYTVQSIDFSPPFLNATRKKRDSLERLLLKNEERARHLSSIIDQSQRDISMEKMADELQERQQMMEKRFAGWTYLQDEIARRSTAIEFRRAGYIRFDLFKERFGSEKAVDVKLAIDLFKLKDIYDVAIVVSGDQDYVPAIDTIKDFGKHTINVAFLTEKNRLLPGGARRLGQSTDRSVELKHSDLKKYLGL